MAEDLQKVVLEALEQEDPNILRAACTMAGFLRLPQAERGLLKALNHKAWQIQADAARALGLIESKGALPFLRRMLKASDADLRQKILAAAAGAKKEGEEGEEVHPEVRRAAALAINRIQPKAAQDALLAALASDQATLLGAAMAGLANLEAEPGRERMVELLAHPEAAIRKTAAACLGRLHEPMAVPGLMSLLDDPDPEVRKEAVIALNHIKDKQAIEPLCRRMEDGDSEVRRVTAIALGNTRTRQPAVVQALVKGLSDRDPKVRQASLAALANVKAEETLQEAAGLLRDTHEAVARQAGVTVTVLSQASQRPDYESS